MSNDKIMIEINFRSFFFLTVSSIINAVLNLVRFNNNPDKVFLVVAKVPKKEIMNAKY